MYNEYCKLIDKLCCDVIPGYTPVKMIVVTGEYALNPDAPSPVYVAPSLSLEVKIKFGGQNGDS